MKYSREILFKVLVVAYYSVKGETFNEECKYCATDAKLLPQPMKETLKEMASQQQKKSGLRHDSSVSASYFIQPNQEHDPKYISLQIEKMLSAFDIVSKVEQEDGDLLHITLPHVSLESISYGPFELAYHLQEGFDLLAAEPVIVASNYATAEETEGLSSDVCKDALNKEWHLKSTKVPQAWDYSDTQQKPSQGEGIVIAQVDSGYSDHPFFNDVWKDKSKKGINLFSGEDPYDPRDTSIRWLNPNPVKGHGTTVSSPSVNRGTVMMENADAKAPRGSAPKATQYTIRVASSPALFPPDCRRLEKAFDKIADENIDVHVISMALGSPTSIGNLEEKIERVIKNNIIVIAAGGQGVGSYGPVIYPGRYENVITCGGYQWAWGETAELWHERKMEWWDLAHAGTSIDITGPASNVCNPSFAYDYRKRKFNNIYNENSGTNMATGVTTGIAALWLAHHGRDNLIEYFNPEINIQQAFKKVLELTAVKTGWKGTYKREYGHGMIDAEAILKKDLNDIKRAALYDKDATGSHMKTHEDAEAIDNVKEILLDVGFDEESLSLFSTADMQRFSPELLYIAMNGVVDIKKILNSMDNTPGMNNAIPVSSALGAHLKVITIEE